MAKGKNFANSLGSKKLTTLIPSRKQEVKEEEKEIVEEEEVKKKKIATTVTTFRVKDDLLFAIKAVAFWERKKIQDVFNDAMGNYLETLPPATLTKAKEEFKKRNT
jgi:hypothetical protein